MADPKDKIINELTSRLASTEQGLQHALTELQGQARAGTVTAQPQALAGVAHVREGQSAHLAAI